jgi:DNA repair protein RadC
LLEEFGSISGVAAAPATAIARVLGGDAFLAAMLIAGREIFQVGMRERVQRCPIDPGEPALLDYLIGRFAGQQNEQLVVLFLDQERRLLSEETFVSGAIDCVSIKPRVLFSRALALGSRTIVLAHNHPSGDPTPSARDIAATARIAADAERLDIELIDHLVVAGACAVSMRKAGML